MEIKKQLQQEFGLQAWQVENTLALIDAGNTIPFISRYRKEQTGSLSDEVLRELSERLTYLTNLEARKEQVRATIIEQEKMTSEIEKALVQAQTLVEVEDIYRPYKQKKRTRATIAKENGLEPFALILYMQQTHDDLNQCAQGYLNEEKGITDIKQVFDGAKDIIAEMISDDADIRKYLRDHTWNVGKIVTKTKTKETSVYEMYYEYEEPIKKIPGHRILAINRGEKEKILSVKIDGDEERGIGYIEKQVIRNEAFSGTSYIKEAIEDAYKRLIFPSIERELRSYMTENAEDGAIKVFGKNLEQLLLQPPIAGKIILALDPAFRTGCKVAVIDKYGQVLDTGVVYPTPPVNKIAEAKKILGKMINQHQVNLIAIGNGTASRETESFTVEMLKEMKSNIQYVIVNEAGASVYSASKLGTEEFPEYDVALRSAVSIGRRLQDPLAELVKIDPQSIGVGQYQHDMNQKKLAETLSGVVEDSVNRVGIDLNTASVSLLQYISGISKAVAKNIVSYREENGEFKTRKELLKVAKLGPKAFEQSAGFLRIRNGKNPLDNTGVHPESYAATEKFMKLLDLDLHYEVKEMLTKVGSIQHVGEVAEKIGVGEPTLQDIILELKKPGRDPRDEMPKPILRSDVLEMDDLKIGMRLSGTVRNVIDFGAFVDIGVHQDGLVHISKLSKKYIKHPLEVVAIGDIVEVEVISVDVAKKRIGLSMVNED
ncbi:Tex family protein [Vallitaleaceae bacterium 9-2]